MEGMLLSNLRTNYRRVGAESNGYHNGVDWEGSR